MVSAVRVSAHRPADLAAVRAAVALGVEFVELDVQRTRDGVLVLAHDARVLDLKLATGEVEAVRQVLEVVGEGGALFTRDDPASVRAVRAWARATGRDGLLVGPSLGADPPGLPLWRRGLRLAGETLLPGRRLRGCDATLVVAEQALARLTLERWARRHHLPLLVWTVDDDAGLVRWLRSSAWLVTTNRPARALALRRALR